MVCSKCKQNYPIVNKHFKLCQGCNNERLHGSKYGKVYPNIKKKSTFVTGAKSNVKKKSKKSLFSNIKEGVREKDNMLSKDEALYEASFNSSNHKCEECNKDLPTEFRDENGKINARYRYSHIIPKSIAPEIRHDLSNINNLCLRCHIKWENGNKAEMSIFKENYLKFSKYLSSWKTRS
jgi:hypothetical protein